MRHSQRGRRKTKKKRLMGESISTKRKQSITLNATEMLRKIMIERTLNLMA